MARVRSIEKTDYDQTHKDYSESIDAIARAIAVLKKQTQDRAQKAGSFAQLSSLQHLSLIPDKAKKAIDMFVQTNSLAEQEASDEINAAPEANGYEFQSNGVVDMLEKLQSKFIDERTTLEKEEANSKHSFGMLSQDLSAQIAQASKDNGEKSVAKGKTLGLKASKLSDKNE